MLFRSDKSKQIIKATAPVLAEHGYTITSTMYKNMFPKYPEVKSLFNQSHQRVEPGEKFAHQPRSLANAVYAYANNIDDLSVLSAAVERIAEKHVSMNILAPHYQIVGTELIGAIKEVLGEAATEEIVEAWTEGYFFLADIFIQVEKKKMEDRAALNGGWMGYKEFEISRKESTSSIAMSIYLKPKDGNIVPTYKAGQYLGVRVAIPNVGTVQRNYTISGSTDNEFRISIKKESAKGAAHPEGVVSTHLHTLPVGSTVLLTVPSGDFVLNVPDNSPVVFLCLGIGVTSILPLVKEALSSLPNEVFVIQGSRNEEEECFSDEFTALKNQYPERMIFNNYYKTPKELVDKTQSLSFDFVKSQVPEDAYFYFCGPVAWVKEIAQGLASFVPAQKIHHEVFGPTVV